MSQFKAIVKKLVSKDINIGGKPMIKHEITVDADGEDRTLLKFTKPQTTFAPSPGTKIQVTAEAQEDKYGNVTYKVDSKPESFVLLDQNNKSMSTTSTGTRTTGSPTPPERSGYDNNGQKRGNAITNAVSLLIASKETPTKIKLLELARLVYSVSTELEQNPIETTEAITDELKQSNPFA